MTKLLRGYKNVNDIIKERDLFYGQGIDISQGTNTVHPHLIGRPFVDAQKKMLQKFLVVIDKKYTWTVTKALYPRVSITYEPPFLLLKKGLTADCTAVSAFCNAQIVFMQTITAIKGEQKDIDTLKTLSGLFNSQLFAYFILMKGSSIGIEREQAHNKDEKFMMPYVFSNDVLNNVKKLEAHKQLINNSFFDNSLEQHDKQLTNELNQSIYDAFKFNDEERSLINYAQNISIPLLKEGENSRAINKLKENDDVLKAYAQVFVNYFKPHFNNNFGVEVYQTPYCVAMRFYNTNDSIKKPIAFKDKSMNEVLNWMYQLGIEKVMDKLFIQKDVRGFEKDAFYIIKPNEYKCWHKAVAYLDAYEFGQVIEEL